MKRVDYRKLKDSVSMLEALNHYGVRLGKSNGKSWRGDCCLPTHGTDEKRSRNTLTVTETERGWAWACQSDSCTAARGEGKKGGNVIDFVRHMERLPTFYDAALKINEWYNLNAWLSDGVEGQSPRTNERKQIRETVDVAPTNVNKTDCKKNSPLKFPGLKDINPEHEEIQKRGITVETAKNFGVGYFPGTGIMTGRIVFPLYENGVLIGYAGRSLNGAEPKWKLPPGMVKSFCYNLANCDPSKPVILCESFWGPLWFHEHGVQAASLMGTELSEAQERELEPFSVIQLALDNDKAGHDAAEKLAERLNPNHKVMKMFLKE